MGGYNSKLFYSLGLIHPRLRTALLPREMTKKQNSTLSLTIGEPITPAELRHLENGRAITDYLRLATDFLNLQYERTSAPSNLEFADICESDNAASQHLESLQEFRLIESEPFDVYCVPYDRLGPVMTEIGIAREVTFRDVGEGTGQPGGHRPLRPQLPAPVYLGQRRTAHRRRLPHRPPPTPLPTNTVWTPCTPAPCSTSTAPIWTK